MANLPELEEIGIEAEFMWVQIGYERKLIFPVDQGLKYIGSMRGCLELKTPYNNPKLIVRFDEEVKAGFISKAELQETIVAQALLQTGEEDE